MSEYLTTENVVFAVDAEARTIKGLVVPFGITGKNGQGEFQFNAETEFSWPQDLSRLKLLDGHDFSKALGYATQMEVTPTGIVGSFKVARGPEGDRALSMAEDKVLDGLSMGLGAKAKFFAKGGVMHGRVAPITEVSLTPIPAFDDSRVTSVAASAVTEGKEPGMGEQNPEVEAPNAETPGAFDFTAITTAITDGFKGLNVPPRETFSAGSGAKVGDEPLPYRFDGRQGEHDFSTDLFDAVRFGNGEARQRIQEFMAAQFAGIAKGDVDEVNPTGYRPDLFQSPPATKTPVADAIQTGVLTSGTPFIVPKFGSSSNMVANHTEGTEPSNDATYTTGSATVTPSPLSGIVKVNREVVDAGGNPQVSGLIWAEVQRQWAISKETAAGAVLTGSAATELGTAITAGAADAALDAALTASLSALSFQDYDFSVALTHVDLFGKLVGAVDEMGRKLFPVLAPSNANGSVSEKYRSVNVGGYDFVPAGALGATATNRKSYLVDPSGIGFWYSAPQRIELPQTVAEGLVFGLWGYKASAVLDANRIKKITYSLA